MFTLLAVLVFISYLSVHRLGRKFYRYLAYVFTFIDGLPDYSSFDPVISFLYSEKIRLKFSQLLFCFLYFVYRSFSCNFSITSKGAADEKFNSLSKKTIPPFKPKTSAAPEVIAKEVKPAGLDDLIADMFDKR